MTTPKPQAWSFSALQSFETCPRLYSLEKIYKLIPYRPSEAAKAGQHTHKVLEWRVKGIELPKTHAHLEPMMAKILATPANSVQAEVQYTFTTKFTQTEWFAKDAWFRAAVDLQMVNGENAVALDWKSGKRKPDSNQLELFAAVIMTANKEIQRVRTGFVWLAVEDPKTKMPAMDTASYERSDVKDIWAKNLARYARLAAAVRDDRFPPKPSGLCKNFCAATNKQCEFSGRPG